MITMENVMQIRNWGPLIAKRCKATGRVVTLERITCPTTGKTINRVAAPGERVPLQQQFLVPDPKRKGKTWRAFLQHLGQLGYQVDHKLLKACDFGAATTRERLFLVARCDGQPINWPEPTHFEKPKRGQKKWPAAAEHIDFTLPCPSIFERPRPLADATMRRIAKGIHKFVLNTNQPFIVPITSVATLVNVANSKTTGRGPNVWSALEPARTITTAPGIAVAAPTLVKFRGQHAGQRLDEPLPVITSGGNCARPAGAAHAMGVASAVLLPATHHGSDRINDPTKPLPTITTAHRGEMMLAAPTLVQTGYGESQGQAPRALDIHKPLGTVVAGGVKHAIASAYLAQMNGGFNTTPGHALTKPASTITNTGSQQQLVAANLVQLNQHCDVRQLDEPLRTVNANGTHHAIATAFLSRQFGNSIGQVMDQPAPTTTAGGGGKTAVVECTLSPEVIEEKALRVAAFLMSYYGTDNTSAPNAPLPTITTKDRLALVTVVIQGNPYVIIDIGLRMLQPPELYGCQGFPSNYIHTHGHDGRTFSKSAQVKMVGNSVSPYPMAALLRVNPPAPVEQLEVAA